LLDRARSIARHRRDSMREATELAIAMHFAARFRRMRFAHSNITDYSTLSAFSAAASDFISRHYVRIPA
jgi:hypothetical protein